MGLVISGVNQKGGVGKTSITRSLAIRLAEEIEKRILIIDADPQGNATRSLISKEARGLFNALSGYEYDILEVSDDVDLLPSSSSLAKLEKTLIGEIDYHTKLSKLLSKERFDRYEYIIIDTPPNLGMLTINALAASKYVFIPENATLFSMQGTNDLLETFRRVKSNLNDNLELLGVVLNAYDPRAEISREIKEELENFFGRLFFTTTLSRSVKFEEAITEQVGITDLRGNFKVKKEFISLVKEFVARLERGEILWEKDLKARL